MTPRISVGLAFLIAVGSWACTKSTPPTTNTNPCPTGGEVRNSAGQCVECLSSTDCAAGTYCDSTGTCSSCTVADGGMPPAGCTRDAGPSSCGKDTDCSTGKYCKSGTCEVGCSTDAECGTGEICTANVCMAGCATDTTCGGLSCCSGMCTDTMTDPTMNCGGCGKAACSATDNACCSGTCADTNTDPNNCGTCGMKCGGTITCVSGMCQNGYAILGLFDVTGGVNVAGTTTQTEVLKPFVTVQAGNPPISNYQALLSGPVCVSAHWDATTPLTAGLDTGPVEITGYAGGTLSAGGTAPSQIDCALLGGNYECAYGMVPTATMTGMVPGELTFGTPTEDVDGGVSDGGSTGDAGSTAPVAPLGATSTVTFSAPGGATFGSFSDPAAANIGLSTMEDLSDPAQVSYSATADTVIHLACPSAGCGTGGYFAIAQASSNSAAEFDQPSTSGGGIVCFGVYGSAFGITLGPSYVTFQQSDIATMLGTDPTITTFATTVVTVSESTAQSMANSMDSEGHHVIALTGTGSYGVIAQH